VVVIGDSIDISKPKKIQIPNKELQILIANQKEIIREHGFGRKYITIVF
jgi:hypothetical protein